MRFEFLTPSAAEPGNPGQPGADLSRPVGATVVRPTTTGGVIVELGPADGPPHLRLTLSAEEALRLSGIIRDVAQGGNEQMLFIDE